MKIFRIGNNIEITWRINKETAAAISKNSNISLLDKDNNRQEFTYVVENNVVTGTFYGKDQTTLGAYRLCLIENYGMYNQAIVDYLNAFSLAANLKNTTSVNDDEVLENAEVYTLSVESFIGANEAESDFAKKSDIPTKVSELENDVPYLTEHQDLSDYAKVEDVPTKTSELENDVPFLTQHQSLEEYAKVEDIPTRVSQLSNDAGYINEHQSLKGYARFEDIPSKVSQLENDIPFLTQHQSLAAYAKLIDIPTKVSAFDNDAHYLTEHQDLSEYAKAKDIPTRVSQLSNDVPYLTDHQSLEDYAKIEFVKGINQTKYDGVKYDKDNGRIDFYVGELVKGSVDVKDLAVDGMLDNVILDSTNNLIFKFNAASQKDDIVVPLGTVFNPNLYYTKIETDDKLNAKAEKSDIPTNVSQLHNDAGYITEHQSLEGYALKTDIPTKASQLTNDVPYLTKHQPLDNYVTIDQLATATQDKIDGATYDKDGRVLKLYADGELKSTVDMSDLAKDGMLENVTLNTNNELVFSFNADAGKEDIKVALKGGDFNPDSYYTKTVIDTKLADKADKTEIPTIPTKVSAFENDKGYLTETQVLSEYALKSELPTKVSQLSNDKGYLTEHQDISGKVNTSDFVTYKNEVTTKLATKQDTLVSGTNVKTINNQSILGSGNITIEGGSTITIDSVMSDTSVNAVQNKVIKSYIDGKVINVPTKTSQLTNDSGFITSADLDTSYAKVTYVDTQDASNLATAKQYSNDNLTTAKQYSNSNLSTAKTYTDTSITNLTWKGTQSEYDALTTIDEKVIYFIKES